MLLLLAAVSIESLGNRHFSEKSSNPYTGLDRSLGLQETEAPRISRQSAHEGGKVFIPMHRPPLPPRSYSWCSFLLGDESIQGHSAAERIK